MSRPGKATGQKNNVANDAKYLTFTLVMAILLAFAACEDHDLPAHLYGSAVPVSKLIKWDESILEI